MLSNSLLFKYNLHVIISNESSYVNPNDLQIWTFYLKRFVGLFSYFYKLLEKTSLLRYSDKSHVLTSLYISGAMVNTANIIETNIFASNGVIHVIDDVIVPSDISTG